jgi:antitoxin component of RelBE/YafQ-DinJ toxin-antitoxin module
VKRYEKIREKDITTAKFRNLIKTMNDTDEVIVPCDKTGKHLTMNTDHYIREVEKHLLKDGSEIKIEDITQKYEEALAMLEEYKIDLSIKERMFLEETINSKAIPTPKILIKDHKDKLQSTNFYPTRPVIPAGSFISGFAKLAEKGIKGLFERKKIQFDKKQLYKHHNLKMNSNNLISKKDKIP